MKVWFTRPSVWDCYVKGIGRCTVWLKKPYFEATPRGTRDIPMFSHLPQGWIVEDEESRPTQVLSRQVQSLLDDYPEIGESLYSSILSSIAWNIGGPDSTARWDALLADIDHKDPEEHSFLLEIEVPPKLWWKIARLQSCHNIEVLRNAQDMLNSDCPF